MKLHFAYYLLLILAVCSVGAISLVKTGQHVSFGSQVSSLQKQLTILKQNKQQAEQSLAKSTTLSAVSNRAENSGFAQSTTLVTIGSQHTVATLQ